MLCQGPFAMRGEVNRLNKVKHAMEQDENSCGKSDNYMAQERAKIGKHAAENRPARAV